MATADARVAAMAGLFNPAARDAIHANTAIAISARPTTRKACIDPEVSGQAAARGVGAAGPAGESGRRVGQKKVFS